MSISLLISLFTFLFHGPQVPNYYRSYPTARAEAAKAQKDMLIFFSSSSCDNCDNAWAAFARDAGAVNKYVSTQVPTDNFDGQILYEHFDPGSVPAWVILDANGKVKERWQGGWKDAYGKGTLFADVTPMTESAKKSETTINTKPVSTSSVPNTPNSSTASKPTTPPSKSSTSSTSSTPSASSTPSTPSTPSTTSTTSTPSTGFIIQAGYFGSETNAQKCLADLKAKGFAGFSIKPLQQNGTTFYRVWSGDYATEKEAQAKLQQLSVSGIKGTVKSAL